VGTKYSCKQPLAILYHWWTSNL